MPTQSQKYQVSQFSVENILNWVKSKEMAIPEIQRPFVWDKTKVRNLMDSLYKGFPVGYLIAWKNPNIKLKGGGTSSGKKILIDGQQRVTALRAAILGESIINKEYQKEYIKIAFHPLKQEFEVQNPAIIKDVAWIPDIAPIVNGEAKITKTIKEYCEKNPNVDADKVEDAIENLKQIQAKMLGFVELEPDLDIETVSVIFERINSEGVPLSQADFAMSKIAVYDDFGSNLRKLIDYFCQLAVSPEFYSQLEITDKEFTKTGYLEKIKWLKDENDDLYDPGYADLLRVAFTSEFNRGKMGDLVSLLTGRNFETREFEAEIQDDTFKRLEKSLLKFTNELNFKKFIMIIRSTGFIDSRLINSRATINFAYVSYLKLRDLNVSQSEIEPFVRKWFVMSILTGRYSSSPESTFDADIKSISKDYQKHLKYVEDTELSEAFWSVALVSELEKSNPTSPYLSTFFASQVKENDRGFLSTNITIRDMVEERGDLHHIFPKAYIKKTFNNKKDYNQIANLVYAQSEINSSIKDTPPSEYFAVVLEQCKGGSVKYGGITELKILKTNMEQNCIPESIVDMSVEHYHEFLKERRELMARKIKNYYNNL
jgi:uncharacterized protein with ParB-like and HNH nuclease domain